MEALLRLVEWVFGPGVAEATWTVDISTVTTDITTIGISILGLVALIFGFRIVKGMLHR